MGTPPDAPYSVKPLVELSVDDWVSELALFVIWRHRGQLTALTSCELVRIRGPEFHLLIEAWGGALHSCLRQFAILLVDHVERAIDKEGKAASPTDLSIGKVALQQLGARALRFWQLRNQRDQFLSSAGEDITDITAAATDSFLAALK